jgi:hypothetical protein
MESPNALGASPPSFLILNLDKVKRLVAYHLDDSVSTPLAVQPFQLESFHATERFETIDRYDFSAAYEALVGSEPALDPTGGIDARMGLLFMGKGDEVLLSAFVDGFGVQGAIGAALVHFSRPQFRRWLEGRFLK